jgi:site-specific recombinase XerD
MLVISHTPSIMDVQTDETALHHYIEEYLGHLADRPRTQRTYKNGLTKFQTFLLERKVRSAARRRHETPSLLRLRDLDESVLVQFNDWLARSSKFTRNTYLASTIMFISYAISKSWLETFSLERAKAQLKHVNREKSGYPIPRPDEGLPQIIQFWDKQPLLDREGEKARRQRLIVLRARAFVHLLYGSAARLQELRLLDVKDIGRGRKAEAVIHGKGDKERFIFITPDARSALRAYLGERDDEFEPVFISHHRNYGARVNDSVLRHIIYRAARALGINASPHAFRHYRASQMLNQGAPLEAIQEILGHSDISTTRRVYAHYSKPAIRAIFERTTLTPEQAAKGQSEQSQDQNE